MSDPNTGNFWPYSLQVDPSEYSSRNRWPKISIVTPSYNQGQFIEQTILSVLHQNYPNLEYIIIDGGSTDNAVEIIKKYSDRITYWVSEKDSGQSEAINKGLRQCSGEIFNWINSDDLLSRSSLLKLANVYLQNPEVKLIAGGCMRISNNVPEEYFYNKQDLTFEGMIAERSHFQQPSQWIILNNAKIAIDQEFQYSFDWDMVLKLNLKESEIKYIPDPLSYFRDHPQSKTNNFDILFDEEKLKSVKKYYLNNNINRWPILRYAILLEAYLQAYHAIKDGRKLLPVLIKKPQYVFSRFFMSYLFKQIFTRKDLKI